MSSNFTKTALVTGTGKRLGQAIVAALEADGWKVAAHYNKTKATSGIPIQGDLTNDVDILRVFTEAQQKLGGEITLLINSASIFEKVAFAETDEDVYNKHMDIHVKAPFFLSQLFAKQMKTSGHIINIADSFTVRNKSSYFAYLLSKKSLCSLSKMLAVELAPEIRVNTILPGVITEYSANLDQEFLKKRLPQVPMQKFASAKDVINAISFLINSNLTGQEIFVDGGEQLI